MDGISTTLILKHKNSDNLASTFLSSKMATGICQPKYQISYVLRSVFLKVLFIPSSCHTASCTNTCN